MRTERLGAFSDAVIAIAITIMVLELPKPEGPTLAALVKDVPVLLAYLLSFTYLGIYWNNHHHMLAAVSRVTGGVLWANLHLLFWLSLVPFVTGWMSEEFTGEWSRQEKIQPVPVVVYGVLLLLNGVAYWILQLQLLRADGADSRLRVALGRDLKGKLTPPVYIAGILLAFVSTTAGLALYVVAAVIWFVPDRRVERLLSRPSPVPPDPVAARGDRI